MLFVVFVEVVVAVSGFVNLVAVGANVWAKPNGDGCVGVRVVVGMIFQDFDKELEGVGEDGFVGAAAPCVRRGTHSRRVVHKHRHTVGSAHNQSDIVKGGHEAVNIGNSQCVANGVFFDQLLDFSSIINMCNPTPMYLLHTNKEGLFPGVLLAQ